jgi:hypothetical protein
VPKFLEDKLRAEYGNNPRAIYGTMNNIGAMHGNKETPKGARMQAKHDAKVGSARKAPAAVAGHPHRNLGAYLHPAKKR